jgi:xylan 1,4-beta-xylosidase
MDESMTLKVNAGAEGQPLKHHWSACVGAGRANEGLRASWLEQLAMAVRECGFRSVRFHGLFHDDMFVYRERDGNPVYNWQYVDDLFDRMLALGARPFVELGFCPNDLAPGTETIMWWKAHGFPPKDPVKWAQLVAEFARHCLRRYGTEEVRSWRFEVWNEPNLQVFFRGTRRQYFELYRDTVRALKAVDAGLRVGGPATANFVCDGRFDGETEQQGASPLLTAEDLDALTWKGAWIREFLDFCAGERLPVDFLSTHAYPTDFAVDLQGVCQGRSRGVHSIVHDLRWLRDALMRSAYPEAELHITEWSSSPSPRDWGHDSLPAAAYIVKANVSSAGLTDSLSYWTFTDIVEEVGAGDTVFHGGFGLINYQGIWKPAFHAYRFLHWLGGEELTRGEDGIVTRRGRDGGIVALLWNYPTRKSVPMANTPDVLNAFVREGKPMEASLEVAGLAPGAVFEAETLDAEHGCAIPVWDAMGRPEPPTREQAAVLREVAMATRRENLRADSRGVLAFSAVVAPWGLVAIRQVSA